MTVWDSGSYRAFLLRTIRRLMVEYMIDILARIMSKLLIYCKGSKKLASKRKNVL